MTETVRYFFGMEIRTTDVYPVEVVGVNNGRFVTLFWQGAEIARIYPAPNNGLHSDGATGCAICGSTNPNVHFTEPHRFTGTPRR